MISYVNQFFLQNRKFYRFLEDSDMYSIIFLAKSSSVFNALL